MNQHHESVSLTAGVFLVDEEIVDQLWSIRDEVLKVSKNGGSCLIMFRLIGNILN